MTTQPQLFVTDYASYNNGTQFEFGHWVDLSTFLSADDFMDYVTAHLKEADRLSPLDSPREEIMFTDFEGFPEVFYSESMSLNEIENIFDFLNLQEEEQIALMYCIEHQGDNFEEAMEHYSDVYLMEYPSCYGDKVQLFEEYYPEAEKASNNCDYVEINYDRFISDNFNEFEFNNQTWLIAQ